MFSHWIKGIYQYLTIKIDLFIAHLFSADFDDIELIKENLTKRNFRWNKEKEIKVIAIFSVSNWETKLIEALQIIGPTFHITWDHIHKFYDTKEAWLTEKKKINDSIRLKFDDLYQENYNYFIFMYVSDFIVDTETVEYLKKKNVIICNFCWDDLLYFKSSYRGQRIGIANISKCVDFNITFSPEATCRYHFSRSPVLFWSSVCFSNSNKDDCNDLIKVNDATEFYVLFIGTKYGWRARFIEKLQKKGIKVVCYGSGWTNGVISEEKMKEEIRNAPITLGFANVGYTRSITTIKGRDFEVPLFGGLYLTQYSKGLELIYEPGLEVMTFNSFQNCLSQIVKVRNEYKWANKVRLAGFKKACQNSNWSSKGLFLRHLLEKVN